MSYLIIFTRFSHNSVISIYSEQITIAYNRILIGPKLSCFLTFLYLISRYILKYKYYFIVISLFDPCTSSILHKERNNKIGRTAKSEYLGLVQICKWVQNYEIVIIKLNTFLGVKNRVTKKEWGKYKRAQIAAEF